jgi:hypothetical protein
MVAYLDRTTGWYRHSYDDDQALMLAKLDLILDRLRAIEERLAQQNIAGQKLPPTTWQR